MRQLDELRSDIYGMAGYDLLKTATEVFLLLNCGVKIDDKDLATRENLFDEFQEGNKQGETVSLDEISDRLRAYLGEGRQRERALVPLEEELALVSAYLDIESLRIGRRLKVERAIDSQFRPILLCIGIVTRSSALPTCFKVIDRPSEFVVLVDPNGYFRSQT